MQRYDNPYPIEKIISAATYLTAGGAGFVWLIIAAIMKKTVRPFLMYHIFQSIFLSIFYFLAKIFVGFVIMILLKIPLIGFLIGKFVYFCIIPLPFILNLSVLQAFTTSIILYLALTSAMGYYSYLPWISDVIKSNFSR